MTIPSTPTTLTLKANPRVSETRRRSSVEGGVRPIVGPLVRRSCSHPEGSRWPSRSPRREPTTRPATTTRTTSPRPRGAATRPGSGDDQRTRVGHDASLRVDRLADVPGQRERVLMGEPVPVIEAALDTLVDEPVDGGRILPPWVDLLRGENEAPGRAEAGDEALVARDDGEDLPQRPVHGGEERQIGHLGHAGLHGERPGRRQAVVDDLVELFAVEQAGGPLLERLDQVADDQVETVAGPDPQSTPLKSNHVPIS